MVQRLERSTAECNLGEKLSLYSCRKAEIALLFLVLCLKKGFQIILWLSKASCKQRDSCPQSIKNSA